MYTCTTVESCDYPPPPSFVRASTGQNWGGFSVSTVKYHVDVRSLYFLWLFDDKVRQNRTQNLMASLIDADTAFIGLWTPIYTFFSQEGGGGGAYRNLSSKCRAGLCIIARFYNNYHHMHAITAHTLLLVCECLSL